MSADIRASDFFVAGGTLHPDAPSYVKRPADDELLNLALASKFCYVLTPRQTGKSSLMVRTARRLQEQGVSTAIIDLTEFGTEAKADQWYLDLIARLQAELELSVDPEAWWAERSSLSAMKRFNDFLHDVVLTEIEGPVVIFIDEIDTTLNLGFSDDFFAAIRFTYNARASDPVYKRLTFVLLGVAMPADLIKDRGRTPFNIGQGITLKDFSRADASVLQAGLEAVHPGQGEAIFTRIYHWTNGHPYLTQKLCLSVAETEDGGWDDERVDRLVETSFLSEEVRKESNLQFVRDGVQNSLNRQQMLAIYRQVYRGKEVPDDERSLGKNRLKMLGMVKSEDGILKVRNEIYRRVFNLDWVRENTPINWAPILAGIASIAIFVALLLGGAILYDTWWLEMQAQDCIASFYQTSARIERLDHLAKLFRLQGLLGTTDYDHKARELFYGLSREEQLELFRAYNAEDSDLIVVTQGLYVTLADIDVTGSTDSLLKEMVRALDYLNETEEIDNLKEEINSWLEGRELARQAQYSDARDAYNKAIELNGENPATLYERARVLIALSEYDQALSDLDQVVAIAGRAPAPTPTATSTTAPTASPTLTPTSISTFTDITLTETLSPIASTTATSPLLPLSTETPTLTATPVPAPIGSEFATTGQMISAVRGMIYDKPDLVSFLTSAPGSEYPNLRRFGLVPSPTDTLIPTATPSPTRASANTPTPKPIVPMPTNRPPVVEEIVASRKVVTPGQTIRLTAIATDPEHDALTYTWTAQKGTVPEGPRMESSVSYTAPGITGDDFVTVTVSDGRGGVGKTEILIRVVEVLTTNTPTPTDTPIPPAAAGRIAFHSYRDGNGEIYTMNADGTDPTRLTNDPAFDGYSTWSPDGKRVAFFSEHDGNQEIYIVNADDTGLTNLTKNSANDGDPAWSPDGQLIAFISDRDGNLEIYVMNADGTDQTRLTSDLASDYGPAWSPDGQHIAFHSNRDGNYDVYVMKADGTGLTKLTDNPADDGSPAWSPGGQRITFDSYRDGNYEICVMNADGTDQTNLTSNPANDGAPAWSPDGQYIVFDSDRDGNQEIYVMNADGTGQTRLTYNPADDKAPAWSP